MNYKTLKALMPHARQLGHKTMGEFIQLLKAREKVQGVAQ